MLWTDNVANCYAKKLRAAKNESIWLAKNARFFFDDCKCYDFIGLKMAMHFNVRKIGQNDAKR